MCFAMLAENDGRLRVGDRPISACEIAEEWGLNLKTVESNLVKLVKAGLILEEGSFFALADFSPGNLKASRCLTRGYDDQCEVPPTPPIKYSSSTSNYNIQSEGNNITLAQRDSGWNPLED